MKVFACTAVILQSVLAFGITKDPSQLSQSLIGIIYNLVKFTAPVFIFGILYTTIRTTPDQEERDWINYAKNQWSALFVPTIYWTLIYLILIPSVQQKHPYNDLVSFLWQFVNGNAAPHLWYNTMMLQFIILMPLFVWIYDQSIRSTKFSLIFFIVATLLFLTWIGFYYENIFTGKLSNELYLFDRVFISFFIYALLGLMFVRYQNFCKKILTKYLWLVVIIFAVSFLYINWELAKFGYPVKLSNAPYYKYSMVVYDLSIIFLIAGLAYYLIERQSKILPLIHFLSQYAYRAYLSNVFWLFIIWKLLDLNTKSTNVWSAIIVSYCFTWLLSFASAYSFHEAWQWLKQHLLQIKI
ncbi:acyltransferase [Companilactobacillus sp.]|jgi:hypothetical protein|uniref:acyltransferase n=1 Tax=Companilactobacillus sp. TaxID=2767905 RepID=UPI0025C58DCA|nr:acyltransferase [Companilactobacillus sp.]MCH4008274.1 acyltransferase [Companilactobacillus sp.]MCH4051547.1 acyltransferase [Companilactobacillus sp.]MCH4076217.1 acyltransferase [Companilactobacillus sp.]MCH4124792.1 acyltransferase [Companilactobacillus sp.]MCH4131334.1 acyltransferase [Companilactobacillus sp.]